MANIDKIIEDEAEIVENCFIESDIQKFYAGKTIFLTGSTGFVGKCLLEKLLRACPKVKRIYLLVRKKRGQSAEERIKTYFEDMLFDTLRTMNTDFVSKIHLMDGDLMQNDMALSEKDKNTIIEEVNIVFHVASVIKFDERMSTALKVNVLGTKMMLDLANKCKHIEGFTYVSTAYSHCYKSHIADEVYPSPADLKTVQDLIATDMATSTGLKDAALADVLGKYPNTYTFTKSIAESFVDAMGKEVLFPCIIYRPSIVMSSWKEPVRSWCGNSVGATLLSIAYGLGILHVAMLGFNVIDFIPVDMSVNSILVSMWDAVRNRPKQSGAFVYNYGSSVENQITIRNYKRMCLQPNGRIMTPSIHTIWKEFVIFTECFWYFAILHVLLHFLPALIIDVCSFVTGKKRRALSTFKKLNKSFLVLGYFSGNEWNIDITRMKKAIDLMSAVDRQLFFCDIRELDWQDYCSTYWDGLRLYVLKDPMSTLPAAKRKLRTIETAHYTIKYTLLLLSTYLILRLLCLFQIEFEFFSRVREVSSNATMY